jgi:hypothetical protein
MDDALPRAYSRRADLSFTGEFTLLDDRQDDPGSTSRVVEVDDFGG